MNILWLSFLATLGVVSAKFACVNIIGKLKCFKDSLKHSNVMIEIYDADFSDSDTIWKAIDPDDIMGMTFSQTDGSFAIYACGTDYGVFFENFPDPYMYIKHSCATGSETPYKFEFPVVFAPQTIDLGVLILDDGIPVAEEHYSMHNEETIEISSNFDDLDFGIQNDVVQFAKRKTVDSLIPQTSSISALTCGVLKKCCVRFINVDESSLENHVIGFDDCSKKIFLRAEVKSDNLNKGEDLTNESLPGFRVFSCKGDIPQQYISKKIGGIDSGFNVFPLNPNVDMEPLKEATEKVYEHVNNVDDGEENSARLMYFMNYVYDNQNTHGERPSQIYFNFKLYKNGQFTGKEIEGKIENPMPPPMIYPVKKQQ